MKLVERMLRVCKAVKAKGGYLEESQISFDLFNTFLVTNWQVSSLTFSTCP